MMRADRIVNLRAALILSGTALALAGCSDGGKADSTGEATVAGSDGSGDAPTTAGGDTGDTGPAAAITWHQDIAPIVAQKCGGCHLAGGIAPFSLETYESSFPFAAALLDAVERRSMPPFLADSTDEC